MARAVLIAAHPGASGVELLGVRDILDLANAYARTVGAPEPFEVVLATHDRAPTRLWPGLGLGPVRSLRTIRGTVDTLIVVGGPATQEPAEIPALVDGVRDVARRSRRILGPCTGALILDAAGLLAGRACTTRWIWGDILVTRRPLVDGDVWTTPGLTSGFELLLALVQRDACVEAARHIGDRMPVIGPRAGHATFTDWGEACVARLACPDRARPIPDDTSPKEAS